MSETETEVETQEVKDAREAIQRVVERYQFMRAPGVVLAAMRSKFQKYVQNRIEEDIDGRFKDKSPTELDTLLIAVTKEMGILAEENERKKAEAEAAELARLEAEKAAIKEKKEQNRAEKRAAKKAK